MISKKAYRLKKARFKKNYYNTLKIAAELDELEEEGPPSRKNTWMIVGIIWGSIAGIVTALDLTVLWNKFSTNPVIRYFEELDIPTRELSEKFSEAGSWGELYMRSVPEDEKAFGELAVSGYYIQTAQKAMLSIAIILYCVAVATLISKLIHEKRRSGMSWVEFAKYLFKSGRSKLESMFNKLLRRPSSEVDALVKASVRSDGSLDKKAVKNYLANSISG